MSSYFLFLVICYTYVYLSISYNIPSHCHEDGNKSLPYNTYILKVEHQGFDDHPGALVYVPSTFNNNLAELEIVVYIHGYYNCIQNIVLAVEKACNCSKNQDVRTSYNLIEQFESATRHTKKNWLFIAAEVAYDQANDSPGKWSLENQFKLYLDEVLEEMGPILNRRYDLTSINRIRIFSHSGGYYSIGNMAIVGGMLDTVKDLTLFDSLYANFDQFDSYVVNNLNNFGLTSQDFRFSSIFTEDGGTYKNNVDMEERASGWVDDANISSSILLIDNSLSNLNSTAIQSYSLLFKLVNLTHEEIPLKMFYDFLINAD